MTGLYETQDFTAMLQQKFTKPDIMVGCETLTQPQAACKQWGSTKECLEFAQQGHLPRLRMLQAQGGLSRATGPRELRGSFDLDPQSTQRIQTLWKPAARGRQEGILEGCFQHRMNGLRWLRAGHTNTTSLLPLSR